MAKPLKGYLIEALWNWCTDSGKSPYLAIKVDDDCRVPEAFVTDGQIVLDISDEAVQGLAFDDEGVSFEARFGEAAFACFAPYPNIIGAFPSDNPPEGLFFPFEKSATKATENPSPTTQATPGFSRVK